MTSNQTTLACEMAAVLGEFTAVSARLASLAAAGGWSAVHTASLPGLVAAAALAGDQSQSVITLGVGQLHRSGALAAQGYLSTTRWMENEVGA